MNMLSQGGKLPSPSVLARRAAKVINIVGTGTDPRSNITKYTVPGIPNMVIPAGCKPGSIKVDWIPVGQATPHSGVAGRLPHRATGGAKRSQECQSQTTEYLHPGLASPCLNLVSRLKPQAEKVIKILRTVPYSYAYSYCPVI